MCKTLGSIIQDVEDLRVNYTGCGQQYAATDLAENVEIIHYLRLKTRTMFRREDLSPSSGRKGMGRTFCGSPFRRCQSLSLGR
jgi:hypothetical protein